MMRLFRVLLVLHPWRTAVMMTGMWLFCLMTSRTPVMDFPPMFGCYCLGVYIRLRLLGPDA